MRLADATRKSSVYCHQLSVVWTDDGLLITAYHVSETHGSDHLSRPTIACRLERFFSMNP